MEKIYFINLINWLCDVNLKCIEIEKDLKKGYIKNIRAKKLRKRFDKLNKLIVKINQEVISYLSEKEF